MLYEIRLGLVHVNFEKAETDGNTKLTAAISRNRRLHSQQQNRIPCSRDYRLHSFLPRTIREWNENLTDEMVTAESLDIFKSRTSKHNLG